MNKNLPKDKLKIIHWNCFKLNQIKCKELENFLYDSLPSSKILN